MRKLGLCVVALVLSTSANAAEIIGLYNTGVKSGGKNSGVAGGVTTGNGSEPHWTMAVMSGTAPAAAFNGGNNSTFPLARNWIPDNVTSRWVTPSSVAGTSYDPLIAGKYIFSLKFNLSAPKAASANFTGRYATDNSVTRILLNTTLLNTVGGGFGTFTPFSATSGFVTGVNTLSFDVTNFQGQGRNPLGFRAEFLSSSAVPEPATWAMMIGGFGIAGVALRRRRTLIARTA